MRTELMTLAYNEEFLLPFFLQHYKNVDTIHLFVDNDTNDCTKEIAARFPNVKLYDFVFPDGMDDILKTLHFNNFYQKLDCDWVILVDIDEFVFRYPGEDRFFKADDICFTKLFNVYRHVSESDLVPEVSVFSQRRHGFLDPMYMKPNVVRGGLKDFRWGLGIHECWVGDTHYASHVTKGDFPLIGAHWAMADPEFVIERRIKGRKERQSRSNLEKGLTVQHHHITEEQLRAELKAHENDPRVF